MFYILVRVKMKLMAF